MQRRTVLQGVSGSVLSGTLAGCLIGVGNPLEATTPENQTYPNPPANLTTETAKQVALEYEVALFQNELQNEHSFVDASDARVVNRSSGGIYIVTVIHYGEEEYNAGEGWGCQIDATYFVNTTTIRRIGGTDITASRRCKDPWPPDGDL